MLGSLGTSIYRMLMDGVNVADFDAAERATVKTTIGGAVEAARALQYSAVRVWLEAARQSAADCEPIVAQLKEALATVAPSRLH
ncbi:hypothetical protein [Rhizobium laguerreae]